MKANVPLLRKIVEWVEEQELLPEIDRTWRQQNWQVGPRDVAWQHAVEVTTLGAPFPKVAVIMESLVPYCNSAFCVAGYIAELDNAWEGSTGSYLTIPDHPKADEDGQVGVWIYAAEKLGITEDQGDVLFKASNTAADIRQIAERFAGEPL